LGGVYAYGHGVAKDFVEVMKWYRLAAEQGLADAQVVLGMVYQEGWQGRDDWHGLRDYGEAAKWYRLAADQGDAWAQFKLGEMYREGQGVPQLFVEAHKWLSLAALRRTAAVGPATRALGLNADGLDEELREKVRRTRDAVSATISPAEVVEAQRLVQEWLTQHQRR
jgi:uncharacterized protein